MSRRIAVLSSIAVLCTACPGTPQSTSQDTGGTPPGPDACVAHCSGRNCGSNGCGGTCGACTGTDTCDEGSGECVCTPTCGTKVCGDNGCGGVCGHCQAATSCSGQGTCVSCTPACGGKVCGLDSNGCSCGLCTGGASCNAAGACVMPVVPDAGPAGLDASTTVPKDAGTPGGSDGGHVVTPGTWSDFATTAGAIADAYCAKYIGCGMIDASQLADCKAVLLAEILDPTVKKSVETGASIFDTAAGNQCLGFINGALTCSASAAQDFQGSSGCDEMIVPNADMGARCYVDSDCKDDNAFCNGPACAQTCQDYYGTVPPGQPCDHVSQFCDSRLGTCNMTNFIIDGGTVSIGGCVAYIADGQACTGTGVPAGASCASTSVCDYSGGGVCRPRVDVGGACTSVYDSRCKTGLFCDQTSTGDAGFVGACAPSHAQGAACTRPEQCAQNTRCESTSATCQPYSRAPGESCATWQYCQPGYCKGASTGVLGICTRPTAAAAGEHCATTSPNDAVCDLGLFCDATTALCQPRYGDGAGPCYENNECTALTDCVKPPVDAGAAPGTCYATKDLGESCASVRCLWMYVCDPTTQICLGPQPSGSSCENGSYCQSGYCVHNHCVAACP